MPNTLDSAPEITPPEVSVTPPEPPTDTSAQLEKFREAIASSSLEENERTAITNNLDALRTRVRDADAAGNTAETRRLLEEFQQQMDLVLAAKKIEEAPPAEVTAAATETAPAPETIKEKVGKAMEWVKEQADTTKWSDKKKAIVALTGIASIAVLGTWLYKKLFKKNETTEPTAEKKSKWWLWIPGIGLGAYLGYKLYQRAQETGSLLEGIQKTAADAADTARAAADAAKKGLETGAAVGGAAYEAGKGFAKPVADTAREIISGGKNTFDALSDAFDPEHPEPFLDHILTKENGTILFNGAYFVVLRPFEYMGSGIKQYAISGEKLMRYFQGKGLDEDFYQVYGSAAGTYFVGKQGLKLLTQGKLGVPFTSFKDRTVSIIKIAGGPITDLAGESAAILKTMASSPNWRETLRVRYIDHSSVMRAIDSMRNQYTFRNIKTIQDIENAVRRWNHYWHIADVVETNSKVNFRLFADADAKNMRNTLDDLAQSIQSAMQKIKLEKGAPEYLLKLKTLSNAGLKDFRQGLRIGWSHHLESQRGTSTGAILDDFIDETIDTPSTSPATESPQASVVDNKPDLRIAPEPENTPDGTPKRKMAAGGESLPETVPQEKPSLRIAPETLPDDVPGEAERVINRVAQNADEAMEMRRGASALTKVGVGINTLFLLYEVAQVVQIWKEVGKLEAEGKMDATLKQAAETKRPIAFMHTEALAADVIAGGIGSVYVLSGRLALVATGVGGLALIALPLGLSIRAGMYDSIADFELQSGMKLSDRLNGNDEKITGAGKEQQLGTLGSHSLTMRLGAALSSATLEDLEQENAEARKEIVMSMILEHLRETAPEDYEALLKKLGVNGINGLMNEKVTTTILFPKMGDAFVNRAKTKTSLTPDVEQALRAFNIRRGMFRSNYLSNEDLQEITYEASELLGAWARMEGADDLVAMQQYATAKETEKKEHATAAMKEIFGERADAMMAMSTTELQRLCEKHARMMVNINYIEHSALQNIIKRRQQTPIEADIITLRERFDALNQFVHVHRHLLALKIEQKTKRAKSAWDVSPDEAFLEAGTYSVTDEFVAFWGNPHAGDEMFSMNAETIQKESERSQWYDQVLKDYNELMGQTRKAA